jgi:Transposase IS66 family
MAVAIADLAEARARRIAGLYEIEAQIRGKSAAERREIRQAQSKPLVGDLKAWLQEQLDQGLCRQAERIRRSGAGAWTTAPAQLRQPYFGRRVTRIRCCAGMTSRRSDFCSPMTCIAPPQHGQVVVSGSKMISIRGRCEGSDLRFPGSFGRGAFRRFAATAVSVV